MKVELRILFDGEGLSRGPVQACLLSGVSPSSPHSLGSLSILDSRAFVVWLGADCGICDSFRQDLVYCLFRQAMPEFSVQRAGQAG